MARYFTQGTFTTETNYADSVRKAMVTGFTSAIAAGKSTWNIVDDGFINGTFERTVFTCTSGTGFSIIVGNHSTSTTTHTFNAYIGQTHLSTSGRTFTSVTFGAVASGALGRPITYTTAVNHDIQVGEIVTITGATDVDANISNGVVLTVPAANQFTVGAQTTGTVTAGSGATVTLLSKIPVTNAVGNGTTVTYTITPTDGFRFAKGDSVAIFGMNPTSFNFNGTILDSTATTVTVTSTVTDTFVSSGSITATNTSFSKSLIRIGINGSATTNDYGYSTGIYNPSSPQTAATPSILESYNYVTIPTTITNWFLVVEDDYAVFSIKDGTAGIGTVWYFGAFDTAVTNPSLTDFAPYCLSQNGATGSSSWFGSTILQSLNNENKTINHQTKIDVNGTLFTGRPATPAMYDVYKAGTKSVLSKINIFRQSSTLTTVTNPNTDGHHRGTLKGVAYASPTGAAWGDQIDVDGTTYLYAGGVSSTFGTAGTNGNMAWWVAIN